MTSAPATESLWEAYDRELVELGSTDPHLVLVAAQHRSSSGAASFGGRFPDRYFPLKSSDDDLVSTAAGLAQRGHRVFGSTWASYVAGTAYNAVRDSLCRPQARVTLVADEGGIDPHAPAFLEDFGILRALPGLSVIVPADGPSTRGAIRALHAQSGPAYVRLSRSELPIVSDGTFVLGRAAERRAGSDLTIVALGALVAHGLSVADDLARIGISTRVLDFASVKPFDEPALLRAARDTGAILVLEEHSVLTGIGALVAATTSENHPVPVRRVGVPDLFAESGPLSDRLDRYGMGRDRIRDEAWELLRLRGKVT